MDGGTKNTIGHSTRVVRALYLLYCVPACLFFSNPHCSGFLNPKKKKKKKSVPVWLDKVPCPNSVIVKFIGKVVIHAPRQVDRRAVCKIWHRGSCDLSGYKKRRRC